MTLREQIEEQNRQWRLFHEWEKQRPIEVRFILTPDSWLPSSSAYFQVTLTGSDCSQTIESVTPEAI